MSGPCPKHHIRRGASSVDCVLPRSRPTDEGNAAGKTEKERERNHRFTFSSFKHPLHQPPPDLVLPLLLFPFNFIPRRHTLSLFFLPFVFPVSKRHQYTRTNDEEIPCTLSCVSFRSRSARNDPKRQASYGKSSRDPLSRQKASKMQYRRTVRFPRSGSRIESRYD